MIFCLQTKKSKYEVKKSSPQHLLSTSNSGIRVALQTISPPRGGAESRRESRSSSNNNNDHDLDKQSIIRIHEFEASCSTEEQPVRLNIEVERHRTDRRLWSDICDEEDEDNEVEHHER